MQDGQQLLEYFFRIGPTKGDRPLDGQELAAWADLLGIEWTPHQAMLLVQLSRAYLGEMHVATSHDAPPPWKMFEKPWKWVQHQNAERRLDKFLK